MGFFFEEKAFDQAGQLAKPKHLAVNKIGHGGWAGGDVGWSGVVWPAITGLVSVLTCPHPASVK